MNGQIRRNRYYDMPCGRVLFRVLGYIPLLVPVMTVVGVELFFHGSKLLAVVMAIDLPIAFVLSLSVLRYDVRERTILLYPAALSTLVGWSLSLAGIYTLAS